MRLSNNLESALCINRLACSCLTCSCLVYAVLLTTQTAQDTTDTTKHCSSLFVYTLHCNPVDFIRETAVDACHYETKLTFVIRYTKTFNKL